MVVFAELNAAWSGKDMACVDPGCRPSRLDRAQAQEARGGGERRRGARGGGVDFGGDMFAPIHMEPEN